MRRFYKYLKSFDSFILDYSKLLGKILSVLAILVFLYKVLTIEDRIYNMEWSISPYWFYLSILFLVCFVINHGLDAYIWRFILKRKSMSISLIEALQMNWKSLLYAISTPNRIGEIPARRMFLKTYDLEEVYKSASTHYIFKPITFLVLLAISLYTHYGEVEFQNYLIGSIALGSGVFFLYQRSRTYLRLIVLNVFRVLSYCVQHLLILMILGHVDIDWSHLNFIVLIHSSGAIIPHVFGTEIFIKSGIYQLADINLLTWGMFTFSLVVLWIVNIVIPALIALRFNKI